MLVDSLSTRQTHLSELESRFINDASFLLFSSAIVQKLCDLKNQGLQSALERAALRGECNFCVRVYHELSLTRNINYAFIFEKPSLGIT